MATDVTYNGVKIHNWITREFNQDLIYDASATDLIGVHYQISGDGYIHAQANIFSTAKHGIQAGDVPTTGNTPTALAAQFERVSQLLAVPRAIFRMTWSGQQVLEAIPATATYASPNIDVENGPKPRGLSVLAVTPRAIRVRWSVEFTLSGCPGGSADPLVRKPPYKIINNRWSIAEGRDADFFTTRRITGTIKFAEGLTPKHAFIGVVMPGLEKGFRRESVEYEPAANGLQAAYSVLDRQVHHSAPWPATTMSVIHSVSTNDAVTYLDDIQVTLSGPPDASRTAMLSRLIQIVDSRTEYFRVAKVDDKQYLLQSAVITEHFGTENMVTANVTIKNYGETTRQILGNILEKHLGKPLSLPAQDGKTYDPTISRAPALHGYDPQGGERDPAFLFLLNCYLQDPCSDIKSIYGGNQGPGEPVETEEKTVPSYMTSTTLSPLPDGSTANYSPEQQTATYTMARLCSRYIRDRNRVMLPLAVAGGSGATAEAADLSAGTARRIITYEAERIGDWPSIPELKDTYSSTDGVSGALLKDDLQLLAPALSVDGQKKMFRVFLKACYGLNKYPTQGSLAVGTLPYTSFTNEQNKFPFESAQTSTIGP